jgi:hypothetical protein
MVPLARNQALCIGIFSYNGQLNFGLTGDYDAMSDLDSFGLDVEAAMGELSKATPKAKRRAAKPAKAKAAKQAKSKAGGSNGGRAKPRRATGKTAS